MGFPNNATFGFASTGGSGGGGGSTTTLGIIEQFEVGVVGAPTQDTTVYELTYSNIITNTLTISVDGTVLPLDRDDRLSYTVVYSSTKATITFNQGMQDGQVYLIQAIKTVL